MVLHRQAMRLNRNFTHRIQTTWDKDRFVHIFNEIFVAPFISDSMESFIAIIFFAWFVMTIPMGITRYYSKLWMNELIAQQGPFNVLAYLIGCKSLEFDTMQYTTEIQHDPNVVPERGSPEELDWVFLYHLLFGICWLTSGFMQIFWARSGWSVSWKCKAQMKIFKFFCSSSSTIINTVQFPIFIKDEQIGAVQVPQSVRQIRRHSISTFAFIFCFKNCNT